MALLIGVALGGALTSLHAQGEHDTLYSKLEVLAELFSHVENNYVDYVSPTDIVYAAAAGATGKLDEHSAFFTPQEYQSLLSTTEGEYAGIGIEIAPTERGVEVMAVFAGSPAAQAGLRRGDVIVGIDGDPIEGVAFDLIQNKLRGPVGTKVVVTLARKGETRHWDFTLVRSWIRVAPIDSRAVDGGIAYVHIKSFSRKVAADLHERLAALPKQGLVIDLRGNPGGLFDEAVAAADVFLRDGMIVSAVGRDNRVIDSFTARDGGDEPAYPVAVLVDDASASAAEILAGALSDRGRARLFGTRTYGKGSVQNIVELSDGSGLKLTIARYLTPAGKRIDGAGLEPHEQIKDSTPEDGDDVLDAALAWLRRARKQGR